MQLPAWSQGARVDRIDRSIFLRHLWLKLRRIKQKADYLYLFEKPQFECIMYYSNRSIADGKGTHKNAAFQ